MPSLSGFGSWLEVVLMDVFLIEDKDVTQQDLISSDFFFAQFACHELFIPWVQGAIGQSGSNLDSEVTQFGSVPENH